MLPVTSQAKSILSTVELQSTNAVQSKLRCPQTLVKKPKQILFICIFNVQRSVAAEYIFRKMLTHEGADYAMKIRVISAGFLGKELTRWFQARAIPLPDPLFNQPPTELIRIALLKRGIDISLHRSRAVSRAMLDCSDIIIPLLSILKKDLISEYPDIGRKVFLPNELLGKEFTFYWEDTCVFPQDSRFYNFVHNDPSYINRNIDELEEYLRLAFSTILSCLLGPKEAGQKETK